MPFCQFSIYSYIPQTIKDEREVIRIPTESMLAQFADINENLKKQSITKDIALNSLLEENEKRVHLPMIDFDTDNPERVKRVIPLMQKYDIPEALIFSSGRSFHLYGLSLLGEEQWQKFMGDCILLNHELIGEEYHRIQTIDDRWIGHSLIRGYSALRISSNQPHYLNEPILQFRLKA